MQIMGWSPMVLLCYFQNIAIKSVEASYET